jgi:serine phosphatase RsbU (regulator of sigma subunit)
MISERVKPKLLWFRLSIGFGGLLALLLLAQTLATYNFVSRSLIRQEAVRDADRRVQTITRMARQAAVTEPAKLTAILNELVKDDADQIAWIRIINFEGRVLAAGGDTSPAGAYKPGEIGKLMGDRERIPAEVNTNSGRAFVILNPVRFGALGFGRGPGEPPLPPAPPQLSAPNGEQAGGGGRGRGRRPPEVAEFGILRRGISTKFGPLQTNLIVGCAASIALLGAMLIIALRFRGYMQSKHIEEELSVARRVQHDLFPNDDSISSRLGFAARCIPAYQVGGDLYDVFETDDGEVALILGDVSGKGLPAALLMGVVQGAVRASIGTGAASNHEQAAERLNHLMCMKTARERFVSLFWCYYDRDNGVLRYVNAGHLPPLLMRRSAAGPEILKLDEGGPVFGLLPGVRYKQASIDCKPGDILVVFSDGIQEAANAKDEEFGEDGIAASLERNWHRPPAELCSAILADVRTFMGGCLPSDDQTLLVVKLDPVTTIQETAEHAAALIR